MSLTDKNNFVLERSLTYLRTNRAQEAYRFRLYHCIC